MRSQLIRDTRSWATLISILIVFFYKMLIARWCCLLTSYSRKAKDEDGRRVLRPGRIVLSLLLFLAGSSFFLCVSRCRLGLRSSLRSQPWQKKKKKEKKNTSFEYFVCAVLVCVVWESSSGLPSFGNIFGHSLARLTDDVECRGACDPVRFVFFVDCLFVFQRTVELRLLFVS